jgi:hypothetical protein
LQLSFQFLLVSEDAARDRSIARSLKHELTQINWTSFHSLKCVLSDSPACSFSHPPIRSLTLRRSLTEPLTDTNPHTHTLTLTLTLTLTRRLSCSATALSESSSQSLLQNQLLKSLGCPQPSKSTLQSSRSSFASSNGTCIQTSLPTLQTRHVWPTQPIMCTLCWRVFQHNSLRQITSWNARRNCIGRARICFEECLRSTPTCQTQDWQARISCRPLFRTAVRCWLTISCRGIARVPVLLEMTIVVVDDRQGVLDVQYPLFASCVCKHTLTPSASHVAYATAAANRRPAGAIRSRRGVQSTQQGQFDSQRPTLARAAHASIGRAQGYRNGQHLGP